MAWMLDYLPQIRSDLSRFHNMQGPLEEMDSEPFFAYAQYLSAYEGALFATLMKEREDRDKSTLARHGTQDVSEIPLEEAMRTINDGRQF